MAKATQPAATAQAGNTSATTRQQHLNDLSRINPLIDDCGDTLVVQNVLGFLSFVLNEDTDDGISLSLDDCIGMGAILDSCRQALDCMNTGRTSNERE